MINKARYLADLENLKKVFNEAEAKDESVDIHVKEFLLPESKDRDSFVSWNLSMENDSINFDFILCDGRDAFNIYDFAWHSGDKEEESEQSRTQTLMELHNLIHQLMAAYAALSHARTLYSKNTAADDTTGENA